MRLAGTEPGGEGGPSGAPSSPVPARSHWTCRLALQSRTRSSPDVADEETGREQSSNASRGTAARWQAGLRPAAPGSAGFTTEFKHIMEPGLKCRGPPAAAITAGVPACCGPARSPVDVVRPGVA